MDVKIIILSIVVVSVVGIIIGIVLGLVAKKFAVEVDERVAAVRDHLAGSNCGGCGFAGCDQCAEAIVSGEAEPNACGPAGAENAALIAEIVGKTADLERKVAFVKCVGTCDKAVKKSNYYGSQNCKTAALMPGGTEKACFTGCMGFGSCVDACEYDAIKIVNGVAVVNPSACVNCGLCRKACPKNLIIEVPAKAKYIVQCNSHDKGKQVKENCAAGCIGCGICAKNCPAEAITMDNNLAVIDQDKCIKCGLCAKKCPVKVISGYRREAMAKDA